MVLFSSAFFPELVAASENCKKSDYDMYREKNASMPHLAEEMAQKTQSGYVQPWEPLESGGRMSVLGDAVHVPG